MRAAAFGEAVGIHSVAASERVVAEPADEDVVAALAVQRIGRRAAEQHVLAVATVERVEPMVADNKVVAIAAVVRRLKIVWPAQVLGPKLHGLAKVNPLERGEVAGFVLTENGEHAAAGIGGERDLQIVYSSASCPDALNTPPPD